MGIRRNERDWAGQLIGWIKSAIEHKTTIFEDVTNDTGVVVESGRTKFPDILLFTDKVSGIIFNGWELKFPDTDVDDIVMLENALEKAKKIQSDSFVTWNGAEAVIWKIDTSDYSLKTLTEIKRYPKEQGINCREDLSNPHSYALHENALKARAYDILHDLEQLYTTGKLKPAINICGTIINAVRETASIVIPQFQQMITDYKGSSVSFRNEFNKWKIYESSTLKILSTSSRTSRSVVPEQVLAKFTFYNLIGKIFFYSTLCENLSGELSPIQLKGQNVKEEITEYFEQAKRIDYQAVFKPYFTDELPFSTISSQAISKFIGLLNEFDFKILPSDVLGNILENLVPNDEKQKFGQYFTAETLADIVAFPAVKTRNDVLFDPTSGTGTFLNSFYRILSYYGCVEHSSLLSQIWGNDISHFPAILSVINLYKQNVVETDNFPRVMRDDFFNLSIGNIVEFPDPTDHQKKKEVNIPLFDGIASNFPFIQQEDIPNEILTVYFRSKFEKRQRAFLNSNNFSINERSDYFTYCVYNSIQFLKEDGVLSAITSNAWLGKEYGFQFKQFLLDNFHVKYVVRSRAEHWFKSSQVSTVFFVVSRAQSEQPTRFITLNIRLQEYFNQDNGVIRIKQIEDMYADIDNCESNNSEWERSSESNNLYVRKDNLYSVCLVERNTLLNSIKNGDNWNNFFVSSKDLLSDIEHCLTQYHPKIAKVIRGERTGWNDMFVIKDREIQDRQISKDYLKPYVKSSGELETIEFKNDYSYKVFVCDKKEDTLDKGTRSWIKKFENMPNRNGSQTIKEACAGHRPYWYTISPRKAHIITSINPYDRWFFTYSNTPFTIDQRLIALQVQDNFDVELIAALLNSAVTFLTLEMRGTSRNLGALDLNANYLKQLKALDPRRLSQEQVKLIKDAFAPLKNRKIDSIEKEVLKADRRNFDETILRVYGLDVSLLNGIYDLLVQTVTDRTQMSER